MPASDETKAQNENVKINSSIIQIRRINIYNSPILSVTCKGKIIYLVLDTGATASLIALEKAKELKLKILPTIHRAVQVDGISNLKVLGEVHTEFERSGITLQFSGLVVNKLGTDILAGTNFHLENDVYSRMAKEMIVINGNRTFQSTPVEVMRMDYEKKPKLVKIKKTEIIMPGDTIDMELPPICPEEGTFLVEPRYDQGPVICKSQITRASNGKLELIVENETNEPIRVKKNSTPIQIREVSDRESDTRTETRKEEQEKVERDLTFQEKIEMAEIDQAQTMNDSQKQKFIKTLKKYEQVLESTLPGYNNHYGKVCASIEFASKARPQPHKTRLPSYGEHGQRLYDQKVNTMKRKGVLVDPYELGIQPRIINDAWVVKKQASA